jgi:hypothetical protein
LCDDEKKMFGLSQVHACAPKSPRRATHGWTPQSPNRAKADAWRRHKSRSCCL